MLSAELTVRGQEITHAYFPRTGFISLVNDIDTHPPLEVGMIGREGMLGSEQVLGLAKTPCEPWCRAKDTVGALVPSPLRKAIEDMPSLQSLLQRTQRSGCTNRRWRPHASGFTRPFKIELGFTKHNALPQLSNDSPSSTGTSATAALGILPTMSN